MSIEEIINRLEFVACAIGGKKGAKVLCGDLDAKALRSAVALLRTHPEAQPNEPLTLEELREMDGQPVWIDFAGGFWELVDAPDRRLWTCRAGQYSMYPLIERIYRRPPKED